MGQRSYFEQAKKTFTTTTKSNYIIALGWSTWRLWLSDIFTGSLSVEYSDKVDAGYVSDLDMNRSNEGWSCVFC